MAATVGIRRTRPLEENPPGAQQFIRLHGGWRPPSGDGQPGGFVFWGESEQPAHVEGELPPRARGRHHPRQVPLESVARLLSGLALPGLSGPGKDLSASKVVLQFPESGDGPLPAVERPVLLDRRRRPRKLSLWVVQTLQADLSATVQLLGVESPPVGDNVELGPDVLYWAQVCRFVLHLLARQRFVPGVALPSGPSGSSDPAIEGRWLPVIDDPQDQERIAALVESMPAGCRSFAAGDEAPALPAEPIIESFLSAAVDACIRSWLVEAPVEASIGAEGLPLLPWWQSLVTKDAAVPVSPVQADQLAHALGAWQRPLNWARGVSMVRTCLRLQEPARPPGIAPESPWAPAKDDPCWRLAYLLQPGDEPSLLVPAAEVWTEPDSPGVLALRKRTPRPTEQLLSDIARISRLYPPLETSLKRKHPDGMALTTEQAYGFLTDIAPLIEESGVGVLVPRWWRSPEGQLGVQVLIKRKSKSKSKSKVQFGESAGGGLFSVDSLAGYDWKLSLGDAPLTADEFRSISTAKSGLVYLRGRWVSVDPARLAATARRWDRRGGVAGILQVLQWAEGIDREAGDGLPVIGVEVEGPWAEALRRLRQPQTIAPAAPPSGFVGELRPYQQRGLAWLRFLHQFGLGACLADDMGLGKTIQFLALLQTIGESRSRISGKAADSAGPSLLLCPTSVLGNWEREAARFTPELRVLLHHGPDRARGKKLRDSVADCDLVLTSYHLLVRDLEDLQKIRWSGFILDEAQAVKNPGSKQTQACRRIEAGWRAAMTGTPVENRLRDLWSIFSVINPGYLGRLEQFQEEFAKPIEGDRDPAATSRLQALVRPFILRRLKTDTSIINDLPPKIETKETCSLTKEQATLYQAQVDRMLQELAEADAGVAAARAQGVAAVNRASFARAGVVLSTLLRLKQVCNHPALMLGDGSALHGRSGKLSRLLELLEEIVGAGDRCLLFTQFATFGHQLQRYLADRLGVKVLFLHGGTSRVGREELVKEFQNPASDARIFLLSLKAGGVGLNLTAATHVLHLDRWWNPAVEDQATDRAYRIGQQRTVQVHKLVCVGTLEENIDRLLAEKRDLAQSIVGGGEEWLASMSTGQIRDLVRLQGAVVED